MKPFYKLGDLVRTAYLKKKISRGDITNWSYMLQKLAKNIKDTILGYHIGVVGKAYGSQSVQLPQKYNEALLRKTKVTLKGKKDVMKGSGLY